MQIVVSTFKKTETPIEIVERKGIGHPDTICDSIADYISIKLAQYYLKKFGKILHFNADKALLSAGETKTKFGGGEIIKPMLLVLGDRATYKVGNEELPINEIIEESVYEWLGKNLRFVGKENLKIQNEIKQGSEELTSIFQETEYLPANDTSALVGYAPMTTLEKTVYEIEQYLNSKDFKKEFPETGEDIKVMGLRINDSYKFTTAIAFVDRFIKNEEAYFRAKEEVKEQIKKFLESKYGIKAEIDVNTLDKKGKGEEGCYLTVTGTSAESADSGEVGRGNRVNGIIALNRPAGSEAAAGKNMVSHVGKIYNILAFNIANEIYAKTGKENYVWLLSQIGRKVNNPLIVSVQVNNLEEKEKAIIEDIVKAKFENLKDFINELIAGKYKVA